MEDALVFLEKNKPITKLLNGTETKKKEEMTILKGKAIQEYAGDWVNFFVDWKQQSQENFQEPLKQAEERYQNL